MDSIKRKKRPIHLDRYYIIDLSDIKDIRYFNEPFRDKELARIAQEYYLGLPAYDIYKGITVKLMGLKKKPYNYPKFSPKVLRDIRMVNISYKKKRLSHKGIEFSSFKKLWEPLSEDKSERKKFFKNGKSVIRTLLLK